MLCPIIKSAIISLFWDSFKSLWQITLDSYYYILKDEFNQLSQLETATILTRCISSARVTNSETRLSTTFYTKKHFPAYPHASVNSENKLHLWIHKIIHFW